MKTKIQLIPTENQLNYLFFAIIPLKKLKRCKSSIENPIKSIRTFRNPVNTGWNPERESGVCSSNFLHANNAFFYFKKIRRKLRGEREREREKPLPFGKFRKRRMGRWWERDVFVFFSSSHFFSSPKRPINHPPVPLEYTNECQQQSKETLQWKRWIVFLFLIAFRASPLNGLSTGSEGKLDGAGRAIRRDGNRRWVALSEEENPPKKPKKKQTKRPRFGSISATNANSPFSSFLADHCLCFFLPFFRVGKLGKNKKKLGKPGGGEGGRKPQIEKKTASKSGRKKMQMIEKWLLKNQSWSLIRLDVKRLFKTR